MTESENHEAPDTGDQGQPGQNEPSRLTRRQILALPTLAIAPNLTQAARDANVSESTLRRWLQEEHFRSELDRLTHETAEIARQGLKDLMVKGFKVLDEMMEDPDPMMRFRAAQAVVHLGVQVCEVEKYRRERRSRGEDCSEEQKAQGNEPG